jgi:hypothetical protein
MSELINLFALVLHNYPFVLGSIAIFILLWQSVVIVGGSEIAVLERRYFGAAMPRGRVVALANQIGVQARTLGPVLHLLIPFLYRTEKHLFTTINENEVDVLESIHGDMTDSPTSPYETGQQ